MQLNQLELILQTTIRCNPTTPVFQFWWTSNMWKHTVEKSPTIESTWINPLNRPNHNSMQPTTHVFQFLWTSNTVRQNTTWINPQLPQTTIRCKPPNPVFQFFCSKYWQYTDKTVSAPKYLSTTDIWTLLQTNTEYICWLGRYVLGVGGEGGAVDMDSWQHLLHRCCCGSSLTSMRKYRQYKRD